MSLPVSVRALCGLLIVLALTAACSADPESPTAEPTPTSVSSGPTLAPESKPLKVSVGEVTGPVQRAYRKNAATKVGRAVDRWLEAAYIAGDYPRKPATFRRGSFPAFTPQAARLARRDLDVMSNRPISDRIDTVHVLTRTARVDLLGTRGRARAATAHVRLVISTEGKVEREVTVRGTLRLIPTPGGWRVFAYDVAKGGDR